MSSNLKFFFKAVPGERIETALTLPEDDRSAISGIVHLSDGTPVVSAMVLLCDAETHEPIAQAFTDETGRFLFGPLASEHLYYIHIYRDTTHVRTLEITI